jgi:epoxyqueuosine reductase QueG
MTPRERIDGIKAVASELGFDRCGAARARPIRHGDLLAPWLAKGCAGTMGYLHRHQASRLDVRAWLPWAQSVIVVALNYYQKRRKVETSKSRNFDPNRDRKGAAGNGVETSKRRNVKTSKADG